MRCNDARARMSAYLDSELDAGSTFEVSKHLEGCVPCCERFDAESAVEGLLAEKLRCGEMSDSQWSELCCSVARPARRRWVRIVGVVAATLAVGAGLWAWNDSDSVIRDGSVDSVLAAFSDAVDAEGEWVDADSAWVELDVTKSSVVPLLEGSVLDLGRASEGHATRLISIRRWELDGVEVTDVRLECCGEPVLLRVSRGVVPPAASVSSIAPDQIQVMARQVGELMAVGVSRHPINHVIAALRPA